MLVFDIETGPLPEEKLRELMPPCDLLPHPGEFDPDSVKLGQMKDQAKIDAKIADAKAKHDAAVASYEKDVADKKAAHEAAFIERAALNAGTGQVLAIGYFSKSANKRKISGNLSCDDDGEREVLRLLWETVAEVGLGKGHRIVGHNIHGFDLPFVMRRSWLLSVPMPDGLMTNGRYFHDCFVDTMKLWNCGTYNGYTGLNELAGYLGLPGKNGNGAEFARLWKTDRKAAIAYLANDLEVTHAVAERLGVR